MRQATENVTIDQLPSGLTVVHRLCPGAQVDYCGVVVRAGSRNDKPELPGMAHFVEHTIFKGTERRSSWHIINRMERVGGELNAYTTKEETVVYTAAPRGNVTRAMELIADLVTASRFPDAEIDKEREVVADEINSYLDSPSEAVFDDFEDLIFAGTPLGHNILGTTEALSHFDSSECREYLHSWYTTSNLCVFYYGAASAARVFAIIERHFASLPVHNCPHVRLPKDFTPCTFDSVRNIDSHQSHTVMGCLTDDIYSDKRHAIALLTNILGGPGMNSLLNVSMREKRGLVYSVEAASALMSDCGLFTVYFGCDNSDTDRCCEIVRKQIRQLVQTPMTEIALNRAKKQYIGQLTVASDVRESLAISTGRAALLFHRITPSKETLANINSVTPHQICEIAESLTNLSRLTLT